MTDFTDQTGHHIVLSQLPQRIISLVPSQTELLAALGLQHEVIGITKFCIHPDNWFRSKTRVGGTKQLNLELIRQLNPDLILANKEENVKEQIELLSAEFPVWTSDIHQLAEAIEMITQVGLLTGKIDQATTLVEEIRKNFSELHIHRERRQAAYLIWKDPYMTVGADTFIHAMMEEAGFSNYFGDKTRYPEITLEQLSQCPLVLLSSEPFPFNEKHLKNMQEALPDTRFMLVDGEMFSWYGSRLQYAPAYFQSLQLE